MVLIQKNVYSFDENAIIHQCVLRIPPAHKSLFNNQEILTFENYKQLKELNDTLKKLNIKKYKFVPSEFEMHAIQSLNKEIEKHVNAHFLEASLKAYFIQQIEDYIANLSEYLDIIKEEVIDDIKELFRRNPAKLKKGRSMPDNDDLKILKAFHKFSCSGIKYIISQDEDFWGYKALIKREFGIDVIEEWNCHFLCR